MPDEIKTIIWSLNSEEAIAATRALVVLLKMDIEERILSPLAKEVDLSDFKNLLTAGGPSAQDLYNSLDSPTIPGEEIAEAARSMLLLAADLGFPDLVKQSCEAAQTHVRDFGTLSGPLILAGLTVVLAWVPVESRSKVRKLHYRLPDGTEVEEEVHEKDVHRVGAEAVKKLAGWWKALLEA